MSTLPDWMIQKLCESWDSEWHPPSGLMLWRPEHRAGVEARPIPDPGPLVEPFDPLLLGPASLDMRLGTVFESGQEMEAYTLRNGIRSNFGVWQKRSDSGNYRVEEKAASEIEVVLKPGQTLICVSAEYYRLPPDIEGELYTKSSAARADINHSTASMIHPGFHGTIAFELVNLGKIPRVVRSGARLVQIKFTKLLAPARVPYFDVPTAKYRGQTDRISTADAEGKT